MSNFISPLSSNLNTSAPYLLQTDSTSSQGPHLGIASGSTRLYSMAEPQEIADISICDKIMDIPYQIFSFFEWIPTRVGIFFNNLFFTLGTSKDEPSKIQDRLVELKRFAYELRGIGTQDRYQRVMTAFSNLSEGAQSAFYNISELELRKKCTQINQSENSMVQDIVDECEMIIGNLQFLGGLLKGFEFTDPTPTPTPAPTPAPTPVPPPPPPIPTHNDAGIAAEIERLNDELYDALGTGFNIPDEFVDIITHDIIFDPVQDSCSVHHFFNRDSIEEHFRTSPTHDCPFSRQYIHDGDITDAPQLQQRILEWIREQHAQHFPPSP